MNTLEQALHPDDLKHQRITEAPHGGRNAEGDIVADSVESSGQGSLWETSADLTPENADEASEEGYNNSVRDFRELHLESPEPPK